MNGEGISRVLGETVRHLRRTKRLTLQSLSDLTGLSTAFLSQVENDQANPTLSSLRKIAGALGVSIFAILAQGELGTTCTRIPRDGRRSFAAPGFKTTYELLSGSLPDAKLQSVLTVLEPGMETCDEPMAHGTWEAEEWVMVLEGVVTIEVGSERYELAAGDAAHFRPAVPHKFRNVGREVARLLSVMSPPSF